MKQLLIFSLWLMALPSHGASLAIDAPQRAAMMKLFSDLPPEDKDAQEIAQVLVDHVEDLTPLELSWIATNNENLTKALLMGLAEQIKDEFHWHLRTPEESVAAFLAYYVVNIVSASSGAADAADGAWDGAWRAAFEVGTRLGFPWAAAREHQMWYYPRVTAQAKCELIDKKLTSNPQRVQILRNVAALTALRWCASTKAKEFRDVVYRTNLDSINSHLINSHLNPLNPKEAWSYGAAEVIVKIQTETDPLARLGNPHILALHQVLGFSQEAR